MQNLKLNRNCFLTPDYKRNALWAYQFFNQMLDRRLFSIPELGLHCEVMQPEEMPIAVQLIGEHYTKYEPINMFFKHSAEAIARERKHRMEELDSVGLSIVVKDDNGHIIACQVNYDFEAYLNDLMDSLPGCLDCKKKIFDVYLEYARNNRIEGKTFKFGQYCVPSEYFGRRLSSYLTYGSSLLAQRLGYTRVFTYASNYFAWNVGVSLGMKVIGKVNFEQFQTADGQFPFRGISKIFEGKGLERADRPTNLVEYAAIKAGNINELVTKGQRILFANVQQII